MTCRAVSLAMFAVGTLACGRPASEDDCRMILEKNVEVELRAQRADETQIANKKKELATSFDADLKQCVGRRVTESTLSCIRAAVTTEQMSKCGKSF